MTETMDRLYLELATVCKARNHREAKVLPLLIQMQDLLKYPSKENIKYAQLLLESATTTLEQK